MKKMDYAPPPNYNTVPRAPSPSMPSESMPLSSMPYQNVTTVSSLAFDKEAQHMTCPHCHANINTRVESEANMKTHLIALLLCALGCCCCAPCIYFMESCMAHKHYCPSCDNYLGMSDN